MHHNSLFPLPLDLADPDYYNPLKQPDEYDDDGMHIFNIALNNNHNNNNTQQIQE